MSLLCRYDWWSCWPAKPTHLHFAKFGWDINSDFLILANANQLTEPLELIQIMHGCIATGKTCSTKSAVVIVREFHTQFKVVGTFSHKIIEIMFLVQVRLMTEVPHTPSSTRSGFKLMTSRSWLYISYKNKVWRAELSWIFRAFGLVESFASPKA